MLRPLDSLRFAIVDTETTGLYPSRDRIIEVAIEQIDSQGNLLSRYETVINPLRDVGLTSLHGITAAEARNAPSFEAVAGDILTRLVNSVWVGHNVSFDVRFLRSEFDRLKYLLPDPPTLCTLRLYHDFGTEVASYKLERLCEAAGIEINRAHSASADAAATAQLLASLLQEVRRSGIAYLEDFAPYGFTTVCNPFLAPDAFPFRASAKSLSRQQTAGAVLSQRESYIKRLVQNLRPSSEYQATDEKVDLYLHLLDRVLEDRSIAPDEEEELLTLAKEWGFSQDDVRRAHEIYVGMLVATALEDKVVTASERQDIESVCTLLGVPLSKIEAMLKQVQEGNMPTLAAIQPGENLRGQSVCFTGVLFGPTGEGISFSRDEAEDLAVQAGLKVVPSVTKKLNLLVVSDPDTQSSKARKAREYGIRIVAEAVFWKAIGVG